VFAAAEATLQGLQVGHLEPPFREIVLTKDGLVFWCWVKTGLPAEKRQDAGDLIRLKLDENLRRQFPSIKRVVAIAI
jgi:hypothetical protein